MAGEEKTEKATTKKRNDARKEGNVLQSKEIGVAASVLGIFAFVRIMAEFMMKSVLSFFQRSFENMGTYEVDTDSYIPLFVDMVTVFVMVVGPVMLAALVLGVIPTLAQTKGLFSMKALKPKFSNLNPLSGIKKLFSLQSVVGIVKGIIEVAIIGVMIYSEIKDRLPVIIALTDAGIMQGIAYTGLAIYDVVMTICILLVFVAAGDYLFQWWNYEKKLKMSKQEVKDEYKQTEGDPQIKSKIKQRQREMAARRMMQDVPGADVVVRNPTHYAVALKYDQDKNKAPIVIAKGKDFLAKKIVSIAEEHDVYCMENPPLARALYAQVDIGREIPYELYDAVAEVLTVVYKEKHKTLHA